MVPPAMNLAPSAARQCLVDARGFDVVKGLHRSPPSSGRLRLRPAHLAHGSNDVGVGAAAADVAGHGVLDVVVRRADGLFQQRHGAHDLAAGAVAALVAVVLHKGRLHGVQVAGLADAFDGRDLVAFMHHREREAAVHATSVHVDRAGAALAVVAAFLRAGQVEPFAQRVQQCGARVEIAQRVFLAVDAQRDGAAAGGFGLILGAGSATGAAAAAREQRRPKGLSLPGRTGTTDG